MIQQRKTIATHAPQWLEAFGQRLERARGGVGLTQSDLAGPTLSKSFVSLLETARSYPSVETLLLLAQRTGSSLSGLLLEQDDLRLDTARSLVALARAAAWNRPLWVLTLVQAAEKLVQDLPLLDRVEIALIRSVAAATENKLAEAHRLAQTALRLAEQGHSDVARGRALCRLGHVAILQRELLAALQLMTESVAAHRKSKSLRSEPGIEALILLGTAAWNLDRHRQARRVCEKALMLATRLHLTLHVGRALITLGMLDWTEGDMSQAVQTLDRAKRIFEETEDLANLSLVLNNLGLLHREMGNFRGALSSLEQSIHIKDKLGHVRSRSTTYEELARLHLQQGALDDAEQAGLHALDDANAVKDRNHRARAYATLGRIKSAQGERAAGIRLLRKALREFKSLGMSGMYSETSRDLQMLLHEGGDGEATQYLAQALGQGNNPSKGHRPGKPSLSRRRASRQSGARKRR